MGGGQDENFVVISFTSDLIMNGGRDRQVLVPIQYLVYLREFLGIQDLAVSRANMKQFVRAA